MKRTEIRYTVTFDGQINVLELNNVLTASELCDILGAEKFREYAMKDGYKRCDQDRSIVAVQYNSLILELGVIPKAVFEKKIARLKQAGKLFVELKNQVKEVKTILI